MGLDVGKKTIGIAIGDPNHVIASPHRILWRQKFTSDMADLFAEMDKLSVGRPDCWLALKYGWQHRSTMRFYQRFLLLIDEIARCACHSS